VRVRTTIALALLVTLSGCSESDEPSTPAPSSTAGAAAGGTVDDPSVIEPTAALLDWNATGYEAASHFVRGDRWRGIVSNDRSVASVAVGTDSGEGIDIGAGPGRTISELLMSSDWAVVVRQDKAETRPSEVDVVDLATGEKTPLVGPTPASGGSWALVDGDLYYPTYGDDRAYCLATSALADSNGEDGWCAPARTGWSGLTASEHGIGMMTFDDARPVACRTLTVLDASGVPQPVTGPAECLGWDVAATADGAIWSEVPKPRRQEEATFHASAGDGFFDLGPGATGSLVPCGDSVFFVRDPQAPDEPARLMRWTPDHTLEIAYETTSRGNAFIAEPVCGGGVLSLSAMGEQGDEQVWASVA
jgi:hypothetical protein